MTTHHTEPSSYVGVVLAGGRSRRMGTDKASLVLAGETLLEHAVGVLHEVFTDVVVLARPGAELTLPAGATRLDDPSPDRGPAAAIYHAVKALKRPVVVIAVDMPDVDATIVRWLVDQSAGARAGMAHTGDRSHPTLAVYTVDAVSQSETPPDDTSLTRWAHQIGLETWNVPPSLCGQTLNINTPEEAARVIQRATSPRARAPMCVHEDEDVEIFWDARLCIHHGSCGVISAAMSANHDIPGDVFEGRALDAMLAITERCPSGALRYKRRDGHSEQPAPRNVITLVDGGPMLARGELDYERFTPPEDMPAVFRRVALCRCGKSQNKPFCDGSHRDRGHRAKEELAPPERRPCAREESSALTIRVRKNGPLRLMGPMTLLVEGRDEPLWSGDECALCRCGASSRRPSCDGTHRFNGFCGH